MWKPLLLLLFSLLAALPGSSAPPSDADMLAAFPHPKGYVCYRTDGKIKIDGDLTDFSWEEKLWSDDFVDIEGDKQPKPRHRTQMAMRWNDEALYIAVWMLEPHLWATLTEHDSVIFQDNDFEVFIDPDGDNHLYAELEVNAKNTTWDLLLTKPYKDGGKAINAWEITGLKTAVKLDGTLNDPSDKDDGWGLEIKWPWASLKELGASVPPKDGDRWRINFSRVEWDLEVIEGKYRKVKDGKGKDKPEHNWVWSPQGVIDMHRPERWGYVQFSTAKPGETEFKPDPDWATRDLLHRAYYAERLFHTKNGKYANSVADLGLKDKSAERLSFETTRSAFEASIPTGDKAAKPRRLTITQDARIRGE